MMLVTVFPAIQGRHRGLELSSLTIGALLVPSRRDIPTRDFTSYPESPQGNRVKALSFPRGCPFAQLCSRKTADFKLLSTDALARNKRLWVQRPNLFAGKYREQGGVS